MGKFLRKIWNALVALICKVPKDKLLHFIAGMMISAFFCIVLGMQVCIIPAIFAGIIKEFFDMWTSDTDDIDWWDILATCAGGAYIQILAIWL